MKKRLMSAIGKSTAKRTLGLSVGLVQAQVASAAVGIAAGVATYRLLRSGS
jgi:hypothetical protein